MPSGSGVFFRDDGRAGLVPGGDGPAVADTAVEEDPVGGELLQAGPSVVPLVDVGLGDRRIDPLDAQPRLGRTVGLDESGVRGIAGVLFEAGAGVVFRSPLHSRP